MKASDVTTYCIDTSCLIAAWDERYPPENFPKFWEYLDKLPSVPTMLRQSPAGSLPLRAEVETSHGYAPYH